MELQTMADDLNRDGLENKIKGIGKQAEGRLRNAVGGMSGDTSEQIKGKAKELEGRAQQKIGDAQRDIARNRDEQDQADRDRARDRDI
jgi:uncharacterized protein YjbJ (UPF0337 family)